MAIWGKNGPSGMRKQTSLIVEACRGGSTLQGVFNFSERPEVKGALQGEMRGRGRLLAY